MAPPLSTEQLRALVDLSKRSRKVRRAAAVARFGGWTGALFAAVTLAGALLSYSAPAVFIGVGLAVVAFGEFHGARLMAGLDPRGPRRLALNQGLLGVVLVGYSMWCLADGPGALAGVATGDADMDAMVAGLARGAHLAVYGTLAAIGVVAPGLTALYYLSRSKQIARLRASTTPDMIEAFKAAA